MCTINPVYAWCALFMLTNDPPLARRDLIAERLRNGQAVVAAALAAEFNVSDDAIRRDLRALATEGVCRRVYGGALPISPMSVPMSVRVTENPQRKIALAKKAVECIKPGELIFLDNGSTNLALAQILPDDYELVVTTNSLIIASALLSRTDIQLIVLGGSVTHQVGGCIDGNALMSLSRMRIDRAFIGACALSPEAGISAVDMADATFKRCLIGVSKHNVVLLTNEKLESHAPHQVAELNQLDTLVVEHDLSESVYESLQLHCPQTIRAAAPV